MTKYISTKGPSRCNRWHQKQDYNRIKTDGRELTEAEEEYHDLSPCGWCVESVDTPSHSKQDWSYQEATE